FRGVAIILNGDLGSNYTYQWTPSSGLNNAQAARPVATPERTTTYLLRATSTSGCVAEDSITIKVIQGIFPPDVFTPNGDGHNDTWEIKGLTEYPNAEVFVFSRWGEIVFYEKGSSQSSFNGTFNGQPLPSDVYVYLIKTNDNDRVLTGKVMLLR
ncbi:MAG: T9SS type B sorting domain-containing protein, partial [Runella sp.]